MNYNKDKQLLNLSKAEIEKELREYKCMRCGAEMEKYSFGLGCQCRCKHCGYKDGCCE